MPTPEPTPAAPLLGPAWTRQLAEIRLRAEQRHAIGGGFVLRTPQDADVRVLLAEIDHLTAELRAARARELFVRQRCDKAWSMAAEDPASDLLRGAAVLGTLIVHGLDELDSVR